MPEELQERTEQATPRRREKARQKGEVPRSRELTSITGTWMIFLYFVFFGYFFNLYNAAHERGLYKD